MKELSLLLLLILAISSCQQEKSYKIETVFTAIVDDNSKLGVCAKTLQHNVKALGYDTAYIQLNGNEIRLSSAITDSSVIEIEKYSALTKPIDIEIWQTLQYIPVTSIMLFDSIPNLEGLEYVNFKAQIPAPRSHMAYAKDESNLEIYQKQIEQRLLSPNKVKLVWSEEASHEGKFVLYILNNTHLKLTLGKENFADVYAERNEASSLSQIMVKLDQKGKGILADMTTEAVSKRSEIVILHEGRVLSAPTITTPLLNGILSISAMHDHEEADIFANKVKMKSYGCDLKLTSQKVIEDGE